LERHEVNQVEKIIKNDSTITHVAVVHCETTTGMLNDIKESMYWKK
jgi:2-aminoethylphosphonate-pyruvate transaminase